MTEKVLCDVELERIHQDTMWGIQNHPYAVWLAILTEEVGEAAKEVNDMACDRIEVSIARRRLREELIQVAAVAAAFVEQLDREDGV